MKTYIFHHRFPSYAERMALITVSALFWRDAFTIPVPPSGEAMALVPIPSEMPATDREKLLSRKESHVR